MTLTKLYGTRTRPCSSLSHHRTIDIWVDSAMHNNTMTMKRWCIIAVMMVRWRDNTITIVWLQDKAIARWHYCTIGYGDSAIAMRQWCNDKSLSGHRYAFIAQLFMKRSFIRNIFWSVKKLDSLIIKRYFKMTSPFDKFINI